MLPAWAMSPWGKAVRVRSGGFMGSTPIHPRRAMMESWNGDGPGCPMAFEFAVLHSPIAPFSLQYYHGTLECRQPEHDRNMGWYLMAPDPPRQEPGTAQVCLTGRGAHTTEAVAKNSRHASDEIWKGASSHCFGWSSAPDMSAMPHLSDTPYAHEGEEWPARHLDRPPPVVFTRLGTF